MNRKKYGVVKLVAIIAAFVAIIVVGFLISYSSVNPAKENINNIEKENSAKVEEEKQTILQPDEVLENQKDESKASIENENSATEKEAAIKSKGNVETIPQQEKLLEMPQNDSTISKESKIDKESQDEAGQKYENAASIQQVKPEAETGEESMGGKYLTYSEAGEVTIGVIFMNPISKDQDTLEFTVMLDTHSEDLSQYKELEKFVELESDNGMVITDGFVWEAESDEGHHVNGSLKIKNSYKGKPILDNNTGYLKLIFKNIAGVKETEHVYQGDTLR